MELAWPRGKVRSRQRSKLCIYVLGKSEKVPEITSVGLWVMEFLKGCSESSDGSRAIGWPHQGSELWAGAHAYRDCVTFVVWGGHQRGVWSPPQESVWICGEKKKKEKKKPKKAMTVFKCRTKRYTSQSTIYFWAFSGGCKSSWHKFLTPTYVFLVGSKWYTKVSRGGEGSALCKGNEISFLLAQPQSPFTYITLSSSMVSIQSHAFTAVERQI